ncbi:hypothetical protein diail_9454 [Diaporthe ilicicola]|nr:hypothetical protein diail_9454 [Diaporthe ilicicola]
MLFFSNGVQLGALAVLSTLAPLVSGQGCQAAPTSRYSTVAGTGYTAKLLLTAGVSNPRGIAFDTAGNLLVVNSGQGVLRVTLGDNNGQPCVTGTKTIISDNSLNHGIDFSADGKTLFVSSQASAYSYAYDAAAGTATGGKAIITGMSHADHVSRTLWASKFKPDLLIVSRGSNANIDPATVDPSVGRSVIKYYSISAVTQTPVDMAKGGVLLAGGLRNSVGVTENPVTGEVWSVENSMDDVTRQGRDIHNNDPAEELNYHGRLNETGNTLQGANFGYPGCVAVWTPGDLSNSALKVGMHFVPNLASGQDAATADAGCTKFTAPKLTLPPHTAPLDIKFNKNATAAYISLHGSWDRNPPDGYRLVKVEFGADGQPTQPSTSTNTSTPVLSNTNTANCFSGCVRPVGLAWDPKGNLYMSSDTTNEIYVISGNM